jgi:hypothetical protein
MIRHLHILLGLAGLATACAPLPHESDTAAAMEEFIELRDEHGARIRSHVRVELQPARAGADVMVDWSNLRHDVWGAPIDPFVDTPRLKLIHLRLSLEETLEGLAKGNISQSAVDLQVSCSSDQARCAFSDFAFAAGHPVDVQGRFVPGDGCWLLTVEHRSGSDAAYLALLPSDETERITAAISSRSSARTVDVDLRALPVVELLDQGWPVLDWGDLTLSSTGGFLEPSQIDRIGVAHLPPSALGDGSVALLEVAEIADRLWYADSRGSSTLPLDELIDADSGEANFPRHLSPGVWLISLHRSSGGQPYPAFVSRLVQAPEEP